MAQMNSSLVGVETVFIPRSPEYSFLASSLVKEVATFGGDVSAWCPPDVLTRLTERLAERARRRPADALTAPAVDAYWLHDRIGR